MSSRCADESSVNCFLIRYGVGGGGVSLPGAIGDFMHFSLFIHPMTSAVQ